MENNPEARSVLTSKLSEVTDSIKTINDALKNAEQHQPWAYLDADQVLYLLTNTFCVSKPMYDLVNQRKEYVKVKDPVFKLK